MAVRRPFLKPVSMFYTYRDINLAKYKVCTNLASSLYLEIYSMLWILPNPLFDQCTFGSADSWRTIFKEHVASEQNDQSVQFWQAVLLLAVCILPQSISWWRQCLTNGVLCTPRKHIGRHVLFSGFDLDRGDKHHIFLVLAPFHAVFWRPSENLSTFHVA